jgi:hypothetical protein
MIFSEKTGESILRQLIVIKDKTRPHDVVGQAISEKPEILLIWRKNRHSGSQMHDARGALCFRIRSGFEKMANSNELFIDEAATRRETTAPKSRASIP